ncbi:class I SAM-dependent methyltransferase [Daejeonella oryzae]|uniref:class I SAM-dependent methyltransferase n=1 Tax=Daejeonella oryzae TaxID=1122943 RepID=UPI00042345ED|nr:class I SAM-dependent methyltransferase [Daejeonella oryzae]
MVQALSFNDHVAEYEEWFTKYPYVFQSEVQAVLDFVPGGDNLRGIEVALGTGRFAKELGIKEGVETTPKMRVLAVKKGIEVLPASAEHLPYKDMQFDFVLMIFCISYFENLSAAFKEAKRVLKNGSSLIVGFIDKDSLIGKYYEKRKSESIFYKKANFYSPNRVISELKKLGFKSLETSQTLFNALDDIKEVETAKPGYGEGSFVLIKAIRS